MNQASEAMPPALTALMETLDFAEDRDQRIQMLIEIGEGYREVPPAVATRPFSEDHKVPACESEAYVWASRRPDGRLDFHFAVENPQGISAKAMAAILADTLSGAPLEQVAAVDPEIVLRIFGRELSMGKSMGLEGMVHMVRRLARAELEAAGS